MTCTPTRLPNGAPVIVCTARPRRRRCSCGCGRYASLLCDHPKEGGGTCDKAIAAECAREVGPDRHHCPAHPVTSPAHDREAEKLQGARPAARVLMDRSRRIGGPWVYRIKNGMPVADQAVVL